MTNCKKLPKPGASLSKKSLSLAGSARLRNQPKIRAWLGFGSKAGWISKLGSARALTYIRIQARLELGLGKKFLSQASLDFLA